MTERMPAGTERDVAAAYSAAAAAWQAGPGRIYDRLAVELVQRSPVPLAGRMVADVGAGTGAATRAVEAAGATPIATDIAAGMLRVLDARMQVVADARHLPFGGGTLGGVVASFSLNHVPDPHAALAECARVVEPGGPILASAYSMEDTHEAKGAVDTAAAELGWAPAAWIDAIRAHSIPVLATVEGALDAAGAAGLEGIDAVSLDIEFPDLGPADLVAWRLGMAQLAPFVAALDAGRRAQLEARALELLGDAPALVRRIIVLTATAP